jgi:hypothetical protein
MTGAEWLDYVELRERGVRHRPAVRSAAPDVVERVEALA